MNEGSVISVLEGLPVLPGKKWIKACAASEVSDDEGMQLPTLPKVAVFASGDELFCIDDTCTHETFSLAEGWVEDCMVECTLHFAKFDLRTGKAMSPPAVEPVAVHPVERVGDNVYVALPADYLIKEAN